MTTDYYPQPTQSDLDNPPVFYKSFNPFWWQVVQGKLEELLFASDWQDFTPEIESAVQQLMISEVNPMQEIGVTARRTTDLACANDTFVTIPFTAAQAPFTPELWNLDGSGKYFTADRDGWWRFDGQITWSPNDNGHRRFQVVKTTLIPEGITEVVFSYLRQSSGGGRSAFIAHSIPVYLNYGDKLELQAWQNSGGSLNVIGSVLNHVWARLSFTGEP